MFNGMYAGAAFFFCIVDTELGNIGWAESLDGSDQTRENPVGSAYKCRNLKSSLKRSLQR